MLLRLTDPSHQGGQDLQVLGLLDVKEGEGSQEESEDSLGDRSRSEGGLEAGLHTHTMCVGSTLSTQPLPRARSVLAQEHAGWAEAPLGFPVLGCTEPQSHVSLPALTWTILGLLQRNFQASPR